MFGRKAQITVIFVADRAVTRVDYDRDLTRPIFETQSTVDVESSLSQSVSQVVAGQPRVANRVVVVSSSVWSQLLQLPAMSVQGIEPEDLGEALKFEAETLSGLDIDDIAISYRAGSRTDELQEYWVSVVSKLELDTIHRLLEVSGARIVNVIHPGGASRPEVDTRRRVELWERSVYLFAAGSKSLTSIRSEVPQIDAEIDEAWILGPDNQLAQDSRPASALCLANESELSNWMASVAEAFSREDYPVPALQVARKVKGTPLRHLGSALLAAAVCGFCIWHWAFVSGRNATLQENIVRVQQPGLQKKKYEAELNSILDSRTKVEAEALDVGDQLQRVQFFVDHQKNRFGLLLELLVELRTPDLVINKLDGNEQGVIISGISLNGESAQAFAKRLRENAVGMGWVVNPAKQEGRQQMTSGGPWDFEILLSDTGPFEQNAGSSSRKVATSN